MYIYCSAHLYFYVRLIEINLILYMTRETILLLHSLIGVLIFATGILQIVLKKGGQLHRLIGQTYLYSWLFLLITGAYLGGLLITIIGIFGFYFTLTGSRFGSFKGINIQLFDKVIMGLGVGISIAMILYAIRLFMKGDNSFSIIFAVFGVIFAFTTIKDVKRYIIQQNINGNNYGKLEWYFEHFKRMYISFIAAVTAFTSIQNIFKNNTLNFLLPALLGAIAINLTQKSYEKKLLKR